MSFVRQIEPEADQFWDRILEHPMVSRLGEGTLDEEPFRYWVKQDYVYLIEYSKTFAFCSARAPDLETTGTFAELLHETLNTEMDLHRSYAAEFGITRRELEQTYPSPTTRGYTDFLVRTASSGDFGAAVAALLPCMWGFNETGIRLKNRGLPEHEQYRRWIEMYSGEEFTELTGWCKELMNDLARGGDEDELKRWRECFRVSARYEYLFWDAAWNREEWPF